MFYDCYSYIGLIRLTYENEAQNFFTTFMKDHMDNYHHQLLELQLLTASNQLSSTRFVEHNIFL